MRVLTPTGQGRPPSYPLPSPSETSTMTTLAIDTPATARKLAAAYLAAVRALADFDERTDREMIRADLLLDDDERHELGKQHDARMNRIMGRLCRAERRLARFILRATGWQAPGRE